MHCDRSESDQATFLACDWSAVTNPALSLTNGWLADSLLWSGQGAGVAAAVSVKVRDDNGIYWLRHKRLLFRVTNKKMISEKIPLPADHKVYCCIYFGKL